MEFGITTFVTDTSIAPGDLAAEVEARDFDSLLLPEHTHIPTSRDTPWGGGPQLPDHYKRTYDPFVALTAAASATSRLRIGTGICLVAERDPIVLAKLVSSLDLISGGRMVFGVGHGWNQEELRNHGIEYSERREIVADRIRLMKACWGHDVIEHRSERHRLTPSWQWPKPIQAPHPPILIGAAPSTNTFWEVVSWADGWLPAEGRHDIASGVEALRRYAEDHDRDPSSIRIVVFQSRGDNQALEMYRNIGVDEVVLYVNPGDRQSVVKELDTYQRLAEWR